MKFYLGVTDNQWYSFLAKQNREDVNFWQPGGKASFKVIPPGAPFLFKLKSPLNAIGGIGFFSSYTTLPISIAWDVFDNGNGCDSFMELQRMILQYKKDKTTINPIIGCMVLTNPIFFKKEDWITTPDNWSKSIVQGKSYTTEEKAGNDLWIKIQGLLQKYMRQTANGEKGQFIIEDTEYPMYGNSILTKVRLGQGAFRILVTDAFNRKCAISGEKTLPVLESAHIKDFAKSGPHLISNALLLRSDLHKLFDAGYLTITTDLKVEISKRIKEEYENGREYYKFHGGNLSNLPLRETDRPEKRFVDWHNENIYKG